MGLRGPAKTPTALTVLRGNPGKRALPKDEPQPRAVPPYCPEHIRADKVALREWKRLLPILTQMRVVSEADYITLGNLCLAYSRSEEHTSELQSLRHLVCRLLLEKN